MIQIDKDGGEAIDQLATLAERSFPQEYGEAWNARQMASMIALPNVTLYTAKDDSLIVGFAITRTIVDECELLLIAVDPAHRRKGIAVELIDRLSADARNGAVSKLFLEMRDGNDAERLYGRQGFERVGHRTDYYRGSDSRRYDAITFAKRL